MAKKPTEKTRRFSCELTAEEYAAFKKLSEANCPPGFKPSLKGELIRLITAASKAK